MFAALLVSAVAAGAERASTIVLVGETSPAFERELTAEASEVGLSLVKDREGDPERALATHGALAVLRVVPPSRVEVWFSANPDRGTAGSHETLTPTGDESEPFAARLVEQVRAHLVRLALLPEERKALPAPPEPATPPPTPKAAPPSDVSDRVQDSGSVRPATGSPLLSVDTGLGATVATGGVPGTVQALVGLRVAPGSFELEAFGLLPLTDSDLSGKEGGASISATIVGAHADYVLSDPGAALRGTLGLGGGAVMLSMLGEPIGAYVGHDESLVAGAAFVDGGVRQRLTGWLSLRASTLVGMAMPRPVITFSGRDAGTWGRAFGVLTASLEFGVPTSKGVP
jgi:hypothetical protein